MSEELKILTTVENEFEADMVAALLSEAGIRSVQQLNNAGVGGRIGGGGKRDVLVAEADLARARDLLDEPTED